MLVSILTLSASCDLLRASAIGRRNKAFGCLTSQWLYSLTETHSLDRASPQDHHSGAAQHVSRRSPSHINLIGMKPGERGSKPHKYPALDTVSPPQWQTSFRRRAEGAIFVVHFADRKHGTSSAGRCLSALVGDLLQGGSMKNALIGC
jgi:hypothetical protein